MRISLFGACALLASIAASQGQFSIAPLSTFGNNGWLAPNGTAGSTYTHLTTSGDQRGIAYGNGSLYLSAGAAGTPMARILDPVTGADLGFLDMTGVTGGARMLVNLGVGADGAVYGANLNTALGDASPFKVYRWANNTAAPVIVYAGGPLAGARLGDSMDVIGSGANTRVVAGYGSSPAIVGNNGYVIIDPTLQTGQNISFSGTSPAAGDFRLGIAFGANSGTVYGDQGGSASDTRWTSYSGGTGTLLGNLALTAAGERQMDVITMNSIQYLATVETGGGVNASTVRIYDLSTASSPQFLGSLKLATTANANGNGTGGVAWGQVTQNPDGTSTAPLFAMNSNNGLQAFSVTVPEPGSAALAMLAISAVLWRNRKSAK